MGFESECDVLVAGSGAGGFAAALTARLRGLDVIMIEKEPLFGGTTAYSAGVIWIPVNSHQKAAGVTDTREDALTYLTHHVGNRLDRARAEAFLDSAPAMLELFEREGIAAFTLALTWADYHPDEPGASQGGRSLVPDDYDGRALGPWFTKLRPPIQTMTAFGGMMVGRNDLPHVFAMTRSMRSALHVGRMLARHARDRLGHSRGTRLVNGNALVARLAVNAFQRGIPLWLSSPIVELVYGGDRVTGAVVERDGKRREIAVRRGVVLACGGFPANAELKRRVYAHVAAGKDHVSLAPSGNTGDGLRLAQSIGGTFHGEVHQPAAWTPVSLVPQPDGSIIPFPHFFDRGKPGYISVDRRGRRFVNEALSYHVFVPALIEACRDDRASGGVDRVRPCRDPPLRSRRAGARADVGEALPAIGLHQAEQFRARTCRDLRDRCGRARTHHRRVQRPRAAGRGPRVPARRRRLSALQRRARPQAQPVRCPTRPATVLRRARHPERIGHVRRHPDQCQRASNRQRQPADRRPLCGRQRCRECNGRHLPGRRHNDRPGNDLWVYRRAPLGRVRIRKSRNLRLFSARASA